MLIGTLESGTLRRQLTVSGRAVRRKRRDRCPTELSPQYDRDEHQDDAHQRQARGDADRPAAHDLPPAHAEQEQQYQPDQVGDPRREVWIWYHEERHHDGKGREQYEQRSGEPAEQRAIARPLLSEQYRAREAEGHDEAEQRFTQPGGRIEVASDEREHDGGLQRGPSRRRGPPGVRGDGHRSPASWARDCSTGRDSVPVTTTSVPARTFSQTGSPIAFAVPCSTPRISPGADTRGSTTSARTTHPASWRAGSRGWGRSVGSTCRSLPRLCSAALERLRRRGIAAVWLQAVGHGRAAAHQQPHQTESPGEEEGLQFALRSGRSASGPKVRALAWRTAPTTAGKSCCVIRVDPAR